MDADVAIIGGGPAGSAAAMTLRKRADISVQVLERNGYGEPKVGESLSPGVRGLLTYLGVWDRFEREQPLRVFGSEAAWGSETLGAMDFIFTLHGAGWALDRRKFEEMLAAEAEKAGARISRQTKVQQCNFDGKLWQIETDRGTRSARFLIDAAGRTSPFSITRGAARHRNDGLTAVTARLRGNPDASQMTRVESFEDGWWYASWLPNGEMIVCLFSDADRVHALRLSDAGVWRRRLLRTRHIAELVHVDDALPDLEVQPAFSGILRGGDAALPTIAAGDAIASRDPLSSSGIPNAIGGGVQAARVAADWLFGKGQLKEAYLASVALDHDAYLRTHWKTYQVEKRWSEKPFWRFRTAQVTRGPTEIVQSRNGASRSVFVPGPVSDWIVSNANSPSSQIDLVANARRAFPHLPDERLLLAIEDLTEAVRPT